LRTEI